MALQGKWYYAERENLFDRSPRSIKLFDKEQSLVSHESVWKDEAVKDHVQNSKCVL